jgi:2-amino-4-hydroxy-6-hydroxymethyldihydropteridine diphosphokinase/dihydropteroate synthase
VKCFVGLGVNLGDRPGMLERAAAALATLPGVSRLRTAPVFQTPALVPPGAPDSWNLPFLNSAVELEWAGTPQELLKALKVTEKELGREEAPTWAPRVIDLDLLAAEGVVVQEKDCRVPHPALPSRAFVLDPLKHLAPGLRLPGFTIPILEQSRRLLPRNPLWMAVLNLTPDSFSDGGELTKEGALSKQLDRLERAGVQCYDLGAESTRPGATPVSEQEEWKRLEPVLRQLAERHKGRHFAPLISVDTYRAATAARALEAGAHIINDVSGLSYPGMLPLLRDSRCQYVLMHSLSVPADRNRVIASELDPVKEVLTWAVRKLEELDAAGVSLDRVLFDPGIGFGKTPAQSLALLRGFDRFYSLPVRLLAGHSRKSFMTAWGTQPVEERDGFSIGASLRLAARGAEVLRVHEAHLHAAAYQASQELA